MNRTDALNFIIQEYSQLIAGTDLTQEDTSAGFKGAIDKSLRELGIARADLTSAEITDDDLCDAYEAFLRYHALERLAAATAPDSTIRLDTGLSVNLSDVFKAVMALLPAAKTEHDRYLASLPGNELSAFGSGYVNLDFREPDGYDY